MSGLALQVASGGRRLTVHCHYCGAVLPCPPDQPDLWAWLKKDDVREFYRSHREHSGASADELVGAEIEFDDELIETEREELPSMVNLLDMEQRRSSNV